MTNKTDKNTDAVREYLAEIGRRGGSANVPKGFSALTDAERKAQGQRAAQARWGTKKKSKKKAGTTGTL